MKQYEKYKPSGIEWLGEIPEHWEVKRLKDIKANINNAFVDGPFGSNLKTEHFIDNGDVYVIDSGYITSGSFVFHRDFKTISLSHFYTVNRSECKADDIIIAKIGANYGMSAILPKLDKRTLVSGNTLKLTVNRKKYFLKYIHFAFLYLKESGQIDILVKGSAQPALSMGLLNDLSFCIPNSLSEQTAIANYLDVKTTAIDRKIELLTAKADKYKSLRRSLINETVCRGLPASEGFTQSETLTKMKDSGIEWIGMIPEHWEVDRLKNLCIYISRGITPVYVENSEFKVINQATFSQGLFDEENIKFTTKSDKRAEAKVNDIIVASTGGGVLGKVYFIDVLSGKYFSDSHVTTIRTNLNRLNPKYLFYFLSINFDLINGIMAKGSTNQTELQRDSLLGFNWCVPPIEEQTAIAQYLNEKTTQIDTILTNISNQINKLTQLRKTLINDVVTGKIKVTE